MNPKGEGKFRVRFAPSPTGPFHLGSARTALFNWLFARKNGGSFILRIEDTDKERSKKEFEEQIFESLRWLNIDFDEGPGKEGKHGPYRQSERTDIYRNYLETLLKEGKAYYCYCTSEELSAQRDQMIAEGLPPKYAGHCRHLTSPPPGKFPQVIRFKIPEVEVSFKDMVRGTVKFDASLFGDLVIAKDLQTPLYNFAVVVDDELMEITHVIRGEDHISNTPKQILLSQALGFKEPVFAHLPLILAADKSKLSKRYAETSLLSYRDSGFLPEAVDNFLALLGWHPQGDRELFSISELAQEFDIKRVQKAGAVFNEEKLSWLNGEHIKKMSDEELFSALKTFTPKDKTVSDEIFKKAIEVVRDRMRTLKDFWPNANFFFELPEYESRLLVWQNDTPDKAKNSLSKTSDIIESLPESPSREEILGVLDPLASELGRGTLFWPLRVALSGRAASPDPTSIIYVIGRNEAKRRVLLAISKLS